MTLATAAAQPALHLPIGIDLTAVIVGALSGAATAAREGLDITGVLILAFSTGLGGGLIRDILLARGTPVALTDPYYLPTVTVAAVIAFFFASALARLTPVLLGLDALTLGLFTVIGAEKAQLAHLPAGSVVFLGVATAVGGTVLRDLILGDPPDIAQPGPINAVAPLIGASLLALLAALGLPRLVIQIATVATVTAIRLLGLWRRWQAPVPIDLTKRLTVPVPTRPRRRRKS